MAAGSEHFEMSLPRGVEEGGASDSVDEAVVVDVEAAVGPKRESSGKALTKAPVR